LYGQALTNIKKENLINKINGKNMLVTVEFEKDNTLYRIERGRKPNVLKLYINNKEKESKDDNSQGDSRETQKYIDDLLGMSHTMFKHLVALNTYTEPFLSMRAADQREVIEQLLGVTILSEKAEVLKLQIKEVKDQIQSEQIKIESIKAANANIEKSIEGLTLKSKAWESKKNSDIEKLATAIANLETVDIDRELALHQELKTWDSKNSQLISLTKQKASYDAAKSQAEKTVKKYENELLYLIDKKCPQCDQQLQDHKHESLSESATKNLNDAVLYLKSVTDNLSAIQEQINSIGVLKSKPITFYDSESEAVGHKSNLENLAARLEQRFEEVNPYDDQIDDLRRTAIQEISWDVINELTKFRDHQEFLLKLLTNKDSFVRKKIINQNLSYLNKRLSYYINKLGLPHQVVFQNDLSVEITQYGQDLDFDNLSRGERNRLILSMSFAFRDVWEGLYQNINLLFIDELIDSGMDAAGVENALSVLKTMARERGKNIYLISHKDELISRVNNVLRVVKENGFSSYGSSTEYAE
jgi:DNA repair exonuclease SbcCD ATPase subunit